MSSHAFSTRVRIRARAVLTRSALHLLAGLVLPLGPTPTPVIAILLVTFLGPITMSIIGTVRAGTFITVRAMWAPTVIGVFAITSADLFFSSHWCTIPASLRRGFAHVEARKKAGDIRF